MTGRRGWRIVLSGAAVLIALLLTIVVTARPADPALWPPPVADAKAEIHVVSHGYHSGLVLSREAVAQSAALRGLAALTAVTQRFAAFRWIEVGWGDEEFYRSVPDIASLDVWLGLRALFWPGNRSAVHVVGLSSDPRTSFPSAEILRVELAEQGFERLLARLESSFARDAHSAPRELGPGLYGPSLFFRGAAPFHALNVCNHWVAKLLHAAGLPIAPVLATLPQGLFLDLRWRAGLMPLPTSRHPG